VSPLTRVLLFLVVVAAVFGSAALYVLERLFRRLTKKPARPLSKFEIVSLGLAAIGVGCIMEGFVEPYFPQVTHVTVRTKKFAPGSKPLRIVHISDIHADKKLRGLAKLPTLIRNEHPDLICFTGDAINESPKNFVWLMRELTQIAPVYAVRGNWDPPEQKRLYASLPVTLLENAALITDMQGHQIVIGGIAADGTVAVKDVFAGAAEFRLFLDHYPDEMQEAKEGGVDLYLAGHTHGGQIRLPWYGALITFSRFDKKYEAGLFHEGDTYMYVNRGVGMEGGPVPRVRFLDRPEVTVIEVVPER
jgi:hypothetical protein